MNQVFLPWIIISSSALLIMLFTAIKRDHLYTSMISSTALLVALIAQLLQVKTASYHSDLIFIDAATALLSALLILLALLLSLLLYPWLKSLNEPKEEYYMLFLLATQGAMIVAASDHFASFFMGLELLSLSIVPMIVYQDKNAKALEAAVKYFVLSALASAIILMGIALLYFYSGSLSFSALLQDTAITELASAQTSNIAYQVAILMLLVGIAFKLSLVPCHLWIADVFEGAPLPTTALLATLSKAAIFVLLIRLFSSGSWQQYPDFITILSLIAGASMLLGNVLALLQTNLLRLLAYSSIAHFGYLLLAILAMHPEQALVSTTSLAAEASLFYLLGYTMTLLGVFLILMLLASQQSSLDFTLERLKGLFWIEPSGAIVLGILFLSLAGIPLTIGFVGKFYLTFAAVNSQLWWLLGTLVISSLLGLFYYLRVILMMVEKPGTVAQKLIVLNPSSVFVLSFMALVVVGIGVFPGPLAAFVQSIIGS
ncbi:MAG: NADH-quinone oxidoreductase subunit N [Oceanospirillaceae bacterium]|nr:NADH-quinone oxidoreductase subunit N [Oceanospirillaceae bacterium]